jgi:hypothetical protein
MIISVLGPRPNTEVAAAGKPEAVLPCEIQAKKQGAAGITAVTVRFSWVFALVRGWASKYLLIQL